MHQNSHELIDENLKDRFNAFISKVLTERYAERWHYLFDHKKWHKIKPWDAWEDNFTLTKKIERRDNVEKLQAHIMKNYGVSEVVFIGLGHNSPKVEKGLINNIIDMMKDNLEGLYITNDKNIFIIKNHDGDIMIIDSSHTQ